jgi:hypothetical protein
MAHDPDDHPGIAIPEADRLDQEQPANPTIASALTWPAPPRQDVDESDLMASAAMTPANSD